MRFTLKKEEFEKIDSFFDILKESPENQAAIQNIEKSLSACFDYTFHISIVDNPSGHLFVMSVFPERSTIDKIVTELMKAGDNSKVIQSLWEKNTTWYIEIDGKLFHREFIEVTGQELTACLLHEVGHVIYSNDITHRISTIMKYEIAKSPMYAKAMAKDTIFKKILSLPILDACIGNYDRNPSSLKQEVKADKFVMKMGYEQPLVLVLQKLIKTSSYPNNGSVNDAMAKNTQYSMKTLEDFQARKANLVKKSLMDVKEAVVSPYVKESVDEFIDSVYTFAYPQSYLTESVKVEIMTRRANDDIDSYVSEFFIFKKTLKRIDPNEIDYAVMKVNSIKSELDRMMVVSYIHAKLDIINYYISILENPDSAKKYNVPHSLDALRAMQTTLLRAKENAMKFKIDNRSHFFVTYPDGYEG